VAEMAGIENLKNRIIKDNEDRAKQIESDASAKAGNIISQAKNKADEIMNNMKLKAESDGKERKERLISRTQLDSRNEVLFAKQEAIDKVLDNVVNRIGQMDDKDYFDFIEKVLLNSVLTGEEEIIFSEKDKRRILPSFINVVNDKLNAIGKRGLLKISEETRDIGSGFILVHGGLEINCSIESQIRLLRDSLEGDLANLLFEGR
jgi:V/A-type H+-transporting ATPase subunit E